MVTRTGTVTISGQDGGYCQARTIREAMASGQRPELFVGAWVFIASMEIHGDDVTFHLADQHAGYVDAIKCRVWES